METVQVPNSGTSSRKKEHLEAGKRKLEEFRKKKAAERAKKASASASHLHHPIENHSSETEQRVHQTDSDGGPIAFDGGVVEAITEPSFNVTTNHDVSTSELLVNNTDSGSLNTSLQAPPKDEEFRGDDASFGSVNIDHKFGDGDTLADAISAERISSFEPQLVQDIDDSNSSHYGKAFSDNSSDNYLKKDFPILNTTTSDYPFVDVSNDRPTNILDQKDSGYTGWKTSSYEDVSNDRPTDILDQKDSGYTGWKTSSYEDISNDRPTNILDQKNSGYTGWKTSSYEGTRNLSSSIGHLSSTNNSSLWPPESESKLSNFDTRNSTNNHLEQSPIIAETNSRRYRPSFLDSINMPRVSSLSEPEKPDLFSSKIHPVDNVASAYKNTPSSFVPSDNGVDPFIHGVSIERNHEFRSPKQDDDFAALEQHIEDLTQEKFSLQRAIEASRTLTESLAAENSALTDSFNQQGSVVHQLRSDMEQLQEEIKVQLVELESLKIEYRNAQLECNAADERAKLLASEVIGLEEKALRLRSSELKLERQLENSQAEISSFKKKVAILEKDRQDLQLTIDALQEEKKLLQFKLRKSSSASGKVANVSTSSSNKRDVSTSTEDLGNKDEVDATTDTSSPEASTSYHLQPENREFNIQDLSLHIPPDQMRMIQNINTLISELGLEKEELVQVLSAESSQVLMLKELNKELSRKLEVQTQRLELLTTQSMVNEIIPARQTESRIINESTSYADEGDEVVERVLGWIMKLFPGGPSRRRTSKLL